MKKINKHNWENYLHSEGGQATISQFTEASEYDIPGEVVLDIIEHYNPRILNNVSEEQIVICTKGMTYDVEDVYYELQQPQTWEEAETFYEELIKRKMNHNYRLALSMNLPLSFALFALNPKQFLPNLYSLNIKNLYKLADTYDLELPPLPKRSDYPGRCAYYLGVCKSLHAFRELNKLSPEELCAFIYDHFPKSLEEEETEPLPKPMHAWFIGGESNDKEEEAEYRFWQMNPDTRRGDILIHYEKTPVSAITSVWRAEEDGFIDPFFYYYAYSFMGCREDVPHITLDELKADEYFSEHSLVRKNMQGVNGWAVSSSDYKRLCEWFRDKGVTAELPELFAPESPKDVILKEESDVEDQLIAPLLEEMGISYERQISYHLGRKDKGRADFILGSSVSPDGLEKRADVIIEAKYNMKNSKEETDAFAQGRSYANQSKARLLVLADKQRVVVYPKKNGEFDRYNNIVIGWNELRCPDCFNLDKYNLLKDYLTNSNI
ncbi:MAG: type I restriction endonuclease subunit R [Prevotella sp.]|nr:type I restriction endonuclease subunit R [Candidatus Prevotella equi]